MILGDDGKKLSKRHGAVSVMQYRDDGYLPQAVKNYLVRLGWAHGDQEIFSEQEMIELFSLDAIGQSASAFNTEKLVWLNQHYIKSLPAEEVASHASWHFEQQGISLENGPALTDVIAIQADRVKTLKELAIATKDLAERSTKGTLSNREYAGGTFAISNLGMFGVSSFVAIIQPPQTAVLAVGAVSKRPVVGENDKIIVFNSTGTTAFCEKEGV